MSSDVTMELVDSSTDWSFSDSDDSDLDELLQDDDTDMMQLLLGIKQIEDRANLLDRRRGSVMGRVCIPRNRALGHEKLMEDYFAEVPTYPPRLFRRRFRMRRSLFETIVRACEANCDQLEAFLSAHRNIEDAQTHHQLTQDLIDHHWQLHGQ